MGEHLTGSLLLIEDDNEDAEVVLRALKRLPDSSLEVRWVKTLKDAQIAVEERAPKIVLADLTLPDAAGLEVVDALARSCDNCSLIVQTGVDDEQTPIRALELGAQDYLTKGTIDTELLNRAIRYADVRRRTQRELFQARRERERSDSELESFANIVAHDLRAPVRTARLFADRLLHHLDSDDETILDFGARLDTNLETVDRMILSMLDYASLRDTAPRSSPVDLGACIDQCAVLVRGDLEDVDACLDIDLEPDMFLMANDAQLTRVFVNLLANAIKYRRPDAPLHVNITGRTVGSKSIIAVVDNGTGIAPQDAERAFAILERLDPQRSGGLGFGLPICRRIVESFNGTIEFVHPSEIGARIEITLPTHNRSRSETDLLVIV